MKKNLKTIIPRYIGLSILMGLIFLSCSSAFAADIFTLTPNASTVFALINAQKTVVYTVKNTSGQDQPRMKFFTSNSGVTIDTSNSTCKEGQTLTNGGTCELYLTIETSHARTFKLKPKACGFNGFVCSFPTAPNRTNVTIIDRVAKAYVANFLDKSVSVININTDQITTTITDPSDTSFEDLFAVAVSPDGSKVYVTSNATSGKVFVIDTAANKVVDSISVGSAPEGVAVSPNAKKVYVTNKLDNTVSVIDATTNTVTTTISGVCKFGMSGTDKDQPVGIVVNPAGTTAYVACEGLTSNDDEGGISTIDLANNTATPWFVKPTGRAKFVGIDISPDGKIVYVSEITPGANRLVAYDAITPQTFLWGTADAAGTDPIGVAVSPDGKEIYVANSGNGTVFVVDAKAPHTVSTVSSVGTAPYGISVTPDGAKVYAADSGASNAIAINASTKTVIKTIGIGSISLSLGKFIG